MTCRRCCEDVGKRLCHVVEITSPIKTDGVQLFQCRHWFTTMLLNTNIARLLPQSWGNDSEYEVATTETFNAANVIIDGKDFDTPTTWTYGECGQPGEYMQLPVGYMTAASSQIVDECGYPGMSYPIRNV